MSRIKHFFLWLWRGDFNEREMSDRAKNVYCMACINAGLRLQSFKISWLSRMSPEALDHLARDYERGCAQAHLIRDGEVAVKS